MKIVPILMILAAATAPAAAGAQHSHAGHAEPAPPASREHSPALAAEIARVRAATERYRDHANAVADGYRLFGAEGPVMGEHWYHPNLTKRPFDISRPSTLQYATVGGRKVLVGVAYTVYHHPGEPVPEGFAGDEDRWHTHDVAKLARAFVTDRPFLRWVVDRRLSRGDGKTHLSMVHAWVWSDNPDGVFAESHRALPYLRAGLPAAWAEGADEAAAMATALLSPTGCRDEMKRVDALARLDGAQKREITATCDRAAATVRAAHHTRTEAAAFNKAVGDAWREHEAVKDRLLTAEQKERLAAVVEHGMLGSH
jgi:hypothetical protein